MLVFVTNIEKKEALFLLRTFSCELILIFNEHEGSRFRIECSTKFGRHFEVGDGTGNRMSQAEGQNKMRLMKEKAQQKVKVGLS